MTRGSQGGVATRPPARLAPGACCLVTGGAGFVGSHLVDALLAGGQRVVALDDLSTGDVENLAAARQHASFRLVVGTVLDRSLVRSLVARADLVFHLAAVVGVPLVMADPARALEINGTGTAHLVDAVVEHRRPLVVVSTSEVYGRSRDLPFREDGDCRIGPSSSPRWSYASSKLVGEQLALAAHREHGVPVVVPRLFNTVGGRQSWRYGMVVPRFVRRAVAGQRLQVYGTGRQTRCFAGVADSVRALVELATAPAAQGEIVNVGGDRELSILDLARLVLRLVDPAGDPEERIDLVPYEAVHGPGFEDIPRRVPDLGKLRRLLGPRPVRPLEASLLDVIESISAGARTTA